MSEKHLKINKQRDSGVDAGKQLCRAGIHERKKAFRELKLFVTYLSVVVLAGFSPLLLSCRAQESTPDPNFPDSSDTVTEKTKDPYRAFTDDSYWNTPIPPDAPLDPNSQAILNFLKEDNAHDYIRFSGLGTDGAWGRPIFWGYASDPVYNVVEGCPPGVTPCSTGTVVPEMHSVHIPEKAESDFNTSDAAMTVYDMVNGFVLGLHRAHKVNNIWYATGSSVHYLASNGLDRKWTQFSDTDPRNAHHRGCPASMIGYRWDEYQAGAILHKLDLFVNTTKNIHVFPYIGDESGTSNPNAPPEGTLIRLKRSVNLDEVEPPLSPAARIVAQMLQTYGVVIGDQSGGAMNLKVETTSVRTGGPQVWTGVLSVNALQGLKIDRDFEVIRMGYGCGSSDLCSPVEQ